MEMAGGLKQDLNPHNGFKKGHKINLGKTNFKGNRHSQKAKQKISNALKGRTSPMLGRHHSRKAKIKISLSQKGKKMSLSSRKKMSKTKKRLYQEGKIIPYAKGKKVSEKTKKLIKKANVGKSYSDKINQKKGNKMENHPNWQGGKSFEPYDKTFNLKFKRAIRKRDNQVCMACQIHREKLNEALSIHHIDYNKLLSIPQNCISLCRNCHTKTNFNRKHWTKFFQDLLSEKYGYTYNNEQVVVDIGVKYDE